MVVVVLVAVGFHLSSNKNMISHPISGWIDRTFGMHSGLILLH
jgi:hypothetical protein